jgi:hypothetical protein
MISGRLMSSPVRSLWQKPAWRQWRCSDDFGHRCVIEGVLASGADAVIVSVASEQRGRRRTRYASAPPRSTLVLIRPAFLHHFGRMVNFTLIAVVLIAAIIGLLFLTRGTAVRRVRGVGVDGTPVSPHEKSFPVTVSLWPGSTLLPGAPDVRARQGVRGQPDHAPAMTRHE